MRYVGQLARACYMVHPLSLRKRRVLTSVPLCMAKGTKLPNPRVADHQVLTAVCTENEGRRVLRDKLVLASRMLGESFPFVEATDD